MRIFSNPAGSSAAISTHVSSLQPSASPTRRCISSLREPIDPAPRSAGGRSTEDNDARSYDGESGEMSERESRRARRDNAFVCSVIGVRWTPLRLIAIISKANSPYFTLPLHGLWAFLRGGGLKFLLQRGASDREPWNAKPYVIELLSHPSRRPRPRTPELCEWWRKWEGGESKKIVPRIRSSTASSSSRRQLTFIWSANWRKTNGRAGTKGPVRCFITVVWGICKRSGGAGCMQNWYGACAPLIWKAAACKFFGRSKQFMRGPVNT